MKPKQIPQPKQDLNICKADFMKRHCWKFLGIDHIGKISFQVFQCTNCGSCIKEQLKFIEAKR